MGQLGAAEKQGLAAHLRFTDLHALVERHIPARWQIVGNEAQRVDVGGFFHGLGNLQDVAPILGLEQAVWEQNVFPGPRRRVFAWRHQVPQSAHAEEVADEGVTFAVPRENDRAAGKLALRFDDARRACQRHFSLKSTVGPVDAHVVDAGSPAQPDGSGDEILARARRLAQGLRGDPASIDPRGDARSDAGSIRTDRRGRIVAPAH